MNNKYEVGDEHVENYDNADYLNGSVQHPAMMGAINSDFIKSTPLDTKTSAGMVGSPSIGTGYIPTPPMSASVTGPTGLVETTYNHENLSKKYKNPQVKQDVPELARNQYSDHS